MRILLIDDMREFGKQIPSPKEGDEWTHAANYESGLFALKFEGPWDLLYLDHDLGTDYVDENGFPSTGYGIMCFLEAYPFFLPKEIKLVTSNPVGKSRMQSVINQLYKDKK